jgi:endogenous inhibitor of DNA gyrase (YacG/DUF329 family)
VTDPYELSPSDLERAYVAPKDPPAGATCAHCGKKLPASVVAHADPFCSAAHCRLWHGLSWEYSGSNVPKSRRREA